MAWRTRLVHGVSYLGILENRSGDPCGFISVERNDISIRKRFSRRIESTEPSVYWRLLFDPEGPVEDGFSPLDEIADELDSDRFTFVGEPYRISWIDRKLQSLVEKWTFG